jgi:DNA anti-recombination protein RmuC
MQDTKRLADRVLALQRHFTQSESDLKEIAISAEKIVKRAGNIEAVELTSADAPRIEG